MTDTTAPSGETTNQTHIGLVADIVAAYVSNNVIQASDIGGLITTVDQAMRSIMGGAVEEVAATPAEPAVPIRKSITPDYLICLDDGRKFKSLKRHLRTKYNMSPEDYRAKWGLPRDYPMVAPNYAQARSELAKSMGLGRKAGETGAAHSQRTKAADKADAPKAASTKAPKAAAKGKAPKAATKGAPKSARATKTVERESAAAAAELAAPSE